MCHVTVLRYFVTVFRYFTCVMLLCSGVPCMLCTYFKVYHEWCVTVLRCIANGV